MWYTIIFIFLCLYVSLIILFNIFKFYGIYKSKIKQLGILMSLLILLVSTYSKIVLVLTCIPPAANDYFSPLFLNSLLRCMYILAILLFPGSSVCKRVDPICISCVFLDHFWMTHAIRTPPVLWSHDCLEYVDMLMSLTTYFCSP